MRTDPDLAYGHEVYAHERACEPDPFAVDNPYLAALELLRLHGEDGAWRLLAGRAFDETFHARHTHRVITQRVLEAFQDLTRSPDPDDWLH